MWRAIVLVATRFILLSEGATFHDLRSQLHQHIVVCHDFCPNAWHAVAECIRGKLQGRYNGYQDTTMHIDEHLLYWSVFQLPGHIPFYQRTGENEGLPVIASSQIQKCSRAYNYVDGNQISEGDDPDIPDDCTHHGGAVVAVSLIEDARAAGNSSLSRYQLGKVRVVALYTPRSTVHHQESVRVTFARMYQEMLRKCTEKQEKQIRHLRRLMPLSTLSELPNLEDLPYIPEAMESMVLDLTDLATCVYARIKKLGQASNMPLAPRALYVFSLSSHPDRYSTRGSSCSNRGQVLEVKVPSQIGEDTKFSTNIHAIFIPPSL